MTTLRTLLAACSLAGATLALQSALAASSPEQINAAFKRADANQDGKLSREESATIPAIAEKFDQLDKDKDGFLSLAEFTAGLVAMGE
jgi:Ca2+-binding EF-hand superfamily protein